MNRAAHELRLAGVALQFLTRVPVRLEDFDPRWLNDSARHFPLVGALVMRRNGPRSGPEAIAIGRYSKSTGSGIAVPPLSRTRWTAASVPSTSKVTDQ